MKYILILLLFCSCSSTFIVNGKEVKQKTKVIGTEERIIGIAGFILGYAIIAPLIVKE